VLKSGRYPVLINIKSIMHVHAVFLNAESLKSSEEKYMKCKEVRCLQFEWSHEKHLLCGGGDKQQKAYCKKKHLTRNRAFSRMLPLCPPLRHFFCLFSSLLFN
jgi:hypothetical protein